MKADVRGKFVEDFFVEQDREWLIAGGIERDNQGDDGKERSVEMTAGDVTISIRKGRLHFWTKYSEDCVLFYRKGENIVAAVLDGVSGNLDGSGGIASRKGAKILVKYLDRLTEESCERVMREYKNECNEKMGHSSATASLILVIFGKKCFLFNKGDSYCFHKSELMNKLHSQGDSIYMWLNSPDDFDIVRFTKEGEITLYSDGFRNKAVDDFTTVRIS